MNEVYAPLKPLSDTEINHILEKGDIDELMRLPLSVGLYHRSWKFAQNLCVRLSDHENAEIRANAVLGFSYIARTKGILEKQIVLPIVLRELEENEEYHWAIVEAVDDINIFMKWKIGIRKSDES